MGAISDNSESPDAAQLLVSLAPIEALGEDLDTVKFSTAHSKRKQFLAALVVTIANVLSGTALGYSGPALPLLLNQNGTNLYGQSYHIDIPMASWIVATMALGCFIGCIIAGPLIERIGRKRSLQYVSNLVFAIGYLLIFFAADTSMILIGRFVCGAGMGFVLSTVTVYVVEIASVDMRGFLGCFVQFMGAVGLLYIYCVGAVLDWYWLALANLVFVPLVAIGLTQVPESPRWLLLKGNEPEALKSLRWLRGRNVEEAIEREVAQIKEDLKVQQEEKVKLKDLAPYWKEFLLSLFLMFLLQFCGIGVLLFYAGVVFTQARSVVDSKVTFILVGVALFFSCLISMVIVPRFGRRIIMITSVFGMGVCLIALGTCLYLIEQTPLDQELAPGLGWLPLAITIIYMLIGNSGYGTLLWVITAELLPRKVRTLGNAIAICFSFLIGFVVSKTFVDLVGALNNSGTFWLYSVINFLGSLILYFSLPETQSKSM